eukprot:scaffold503151_cov15-Prasinocladus_malaysianus.AAC.1
MVCYALTARTSNLSHSISIKWIFASLLHVPIIIAVLAPRHVKKVFVLHHTIHLHEDLRPTSSLPSEWHGDEIPYTAKLVAKEGPAKRPLLAKSTMNFFLLPDGGRWLGSA